MDPHDSHPFSLMPAGSPTFTPVHRHRKAVASAAKNPPLSKPVNPCFSLQCSPLSMGLRHRHSTNTHTHEHWRASNYAKLHLPLPSPPGSPPPCPVPSPLHPLVLALLLSSTPAPPSPLGTNPVHGALPFAEMPAERPHPCPRLPPNPGCSPGLAVATWPAWSSPCSTRPVTRLAAPARPSPPVARSTRRCPRPWRVPAAYWRGA
mmetsp:Transcript_17828/g.49872  ORF Transcript_17828/g.49872 Transcript_17828/m.49872 type:complete len:205 (-) Transcript_17828:584-1198(-)